MGNSENRSNLRNKEDDQGNTVIAPPQSRIVVDSGNGAAAALNGNTTGKGDGLGSSSRVSPRAKLRKIVHHVDENDVFKGLYENPSYNNNNNNLELEYVKPVINNANGSVMIPPDIVNKGSLPYSRTLYGFFIQEKEKEIALPLVRHNIQSMWEEYGIEHIMMNQKGFYFFKFKTDEGMLDALEKGPWAINKIPIFLKRWTPGLILDEKYSKLPVWININDMPLELWNRDGLNIVASMLGIPLAVDRFTASMIMNSSVTGRAGCARVLVDVEATGNWVNQISVSVPNYANDGCSISTLNVEYSWKPGKCSFCKVFDHTDSNCIQRTDTAKDKVNELNEIRLRKEEEERRYKAQPHLYTIIKVARDEDLLEQIGKDIYFDLVDHDKVRCFYIKKQMPFNIFKKEVAKAFGVPVQIQRYWLWGKRQNHTYRPTRSLTAQEERQSVGQLRKVLNKTDNAELKLFLEIEIGQDLHPLQPPRKSKDDILLFFKLYDPEKEKLRYVGSFFVKSSGKPTEIISKLNERAGFSPNEEIELYEEIRSVPCVMCERLDKKTSFRLSQIEDGDIICFQKLSQARAVDKYRYPDVPSFLEYVKNRQMVHFRSLDRPKEDNFCLELSKLHTYDDVTGRVARQLGLDDPSKIRLTRHNCYSQQPNPHPIDFRAAEHLVEMLVHYNQVSDILYYEVLDIHPLESECLKTLKVAFHRATKQEPEVHNITLPKQSTVGDVLNEIKTKVELSHPDAELRLLKIFYHKIYKIFPLAERIENIRDHYWTLRAEEIPEEEKNLEPQDRLIHIYHFTKKAVHNPMRLQNFGEPLVLICHEHETLAAVKVRIQSKLEVPDEEFSKWKFAFVFLGSPEYLQDSDVVSSRFQSNCIYGDWEQYLGLEHLETPS